MELLKENAERWQWAPYGLSLNEGLPWSKEIIGRYADRWIWKKEGLSPNPGLPWTEELIDQYSERWHWGKEGLSMNENLPWTADLIESYRDRWYWDGESGLSGNKGLPWSVELLNRYSDRWDWAALSKNQGVYSALSHHVTPRLIHRILGSSSGHSSIRGSTDFETTEKHVVKAPILGTINLSLIPNTDQFVEEGDSIEKGDLLCIVESMDNQKDLVRCQTPGTVKEVLVEDSEVVESDEPLFVIDEE
jgi:biotin carboxyl carrier protein